MNDPLDDKKNLLLSLKLAQERLEQLKAAVSPTTYGLPELLFPQDAGETSEQYRSRREVAIRNVCCKHLWFVKDNERREIHLVQPMVEMLTDLFYGYVDQGILWKARGCGGSLCAAILIWLCMVYKHTSFIDMAGSGEQAKAVYEYTQGFWNCKAGLKQGFLTGDPLQSSTQTVGGASLKCVACSQTQVRGKHPQGFVADESCQEGDGGGETFNAAMQGPMSEDPHLLLLLSTFHWPLGFFADHWDGAEEKGFKRYKWDVYDVMEQCKEPIDCMTQCPLTRVVEDRDPTGHVVGQKFVGCCGKARTSKGWMTRDRVLKIQKMNMGTDVFEVEYECQRPGLKKQVFDVQVIEDAIVERLQWEAGAKAAVGVDWGLIGQTALVMSVRCTSYVGIPHSRFFTGELVPVVIEALRSWSEEHKVVFPVYVDSSHPFNNLELSQAGFNVIPVAFAKWKDFGYKNVQRGLAHKKIRICKAFNPMLIHQLKQLRKGATGKIVKKEDHGPDALMCAMLHFMILDEFPEVRSLDSDLGEDKPIVYTGQKEGLEVILV